MQGAAHENMLIRQGDDIPRAEIEETLAHSKADLALTEGISANVVERHRRYKKDVGLLLDAIDRELTCVAGRSDQGSQGARGRSAKGDAQRNHHPRQCYRLSLAEV